jgi:hypothetical protein
VKQKELYKKPKKSLRVPGPDGREESGEADGAIPSGLSVSGQGDLLLRRVFRASRKRKTRYPSQTAVRLCHEPFIPLKDVIRELEKEAILHALNEVEGNRRDAATILGMKYTTLHEKLRRLGIRLKRVSMIFLCGILFCFVFAPLGQAHSGLDRKGRALPETMNGQEKALMVTPVVLGEPGRK